MPSAQATRPAETSWVPSCSTAVPPLAHVLAYVHPHGNWIDWRASA